MNRASTIKLALGQFQVRQGEPEANLNTIRALARRAKKAQAELLCLPELCYPGYFLSEADTRRLAEPVDGSFAQALCDCARENRLLLAAGYAELDGKDRETAAVYNSCLLVGDDGRTIGNVRKVYLWGKEKEKFLPGDRFPVFQTRLGKIGILNCYDAEFPEPARILALKGAELILVPAAWSNGAARRWEVDLAANALFNLLFVAGVNQVNPYCCGASMVVGPDGTVRAQADATEETLLLHTIDLEEIRETRGRIPYFADFKPDTFSMEALERY